MSMTQEAMDLAITDLDPDLPWNHPNRVVKAELVCGAIAVAFVMALLVGGFAIGYLAREFWP